MISRSNIPLKGVNILIAGDSQPRMAINPHFFNSARCISQDAEPYYVTYWKLKYIIGKANIDTLILGFSHHNIASSFNDKKLCSKKWSSEMFRISYPIYNITKINNIKVDFREFRKVYFQNMCLFPKKNHLSFFEEYSNTTNRTNITNFNVAIQDHYYEYKEDEWISEVALSNLDSIINLCQDNKIKLILIGSPVHKDYYKRIPPHIMDRFNFEKNKFKKQGLLVIDLTNDFYPDDHYLNTDHLNKKGSSKFSAEILRIIENQKNTNYDKND